MGETVETKSRDHATKTTHCARFCFCGKGLLETGKLLTRGGLQLCESRVGCKEYDLKCEMADIDHLNPTMVNEINVFQKPPVISYINLNGDLCQSTVQWQKFIMTQTSLVYLDS